MSETVWYERLKLSWMTIKITVWRCQHYWINWQNMFTESILHNPRNDRLCASACVINITGNCLCSQSPQCNPPSCLQFYQMFTNFKKFFFTGRLSNKFVKIWLLKILPHLQCVATPTLPCDLSLIVTLVENVACFGHWALQGSAATSIRCGGLSNNHLMANFPENLAVRNFGNRLRSDKVTAISLSSPLLWDTVYTD